MAENNLTIVIIIMSAMLLVQGSVSFYVTAHFIQFSTSATIYPPVEVVYTEFNASTTNFSALDENGLKIITNLTLEVGQYGKVIFDGVTDITVDKDKYNKIDIDANTEFSENRIEIDTSVLTSLRNSASVFIYNITFNDPQIMVDGYACPPTICILIDYTNGTLVFRTTQFSQVYTIQEYTEPEEPAPSGPSGRPVTLPYTNFTVDKEFVKVVLKQGETFLDYVNIENIGDAPLTFRINVEDLGENVAISEDSFVLKPGEEKTLTVAFTVHEEEYADIYTGKLEIVAGTIRKNVLLIMEVKEKRPLFDIFVNLEEIPLEVIPGEEVEADILLYNFGDMKPVDVKLYYSLRDFEGSDILYKYDTFAVEEQKNVIRKVRMPTDSEEGFYLFYARVEYGNETASSSGLIKVVPSRRPAPIELPWYIYLIILIILAAIIAVLLVWKRTGRVVGRRYMDNISNTLGEKMEAVKSMRQRSEDIEKMERMERMEAEARAEREKRRRIETQSRLENIRKSKKGADKGK